MQPDLSIRPYAAISILLAAHFAGAAEIDFDQQIAPLFQQHCLKCHGPAKQQGGLRFDSASGALRAGDSGQVAIVPRDAAASELVRRISSNDEFTRMPPEGDRLSVADRELLTRWIDAEAKWPHSAPPTEPTGGLVVTDEDRQHWSFRPLRQPPVPVPRAAAAVRTPIDAFAVSALEARGLGLARRASARTLIRRIKMDLTGLPPTVEELAQFEQALLVDPEAIEKLIDAYLGAIHYGERWGRHWLDVARYADSHGQEGDQDRPYAYQYRDFVIRALNDDLPFDQFARWQIAGDELAHEDPLAVAATGFLAAGPSTELKEEPLEKEKAKGRFIERMRNRYNELDDVLATFGTGMLGLTLGCARCHDHKYDAIPSRDYYQLLAAFHSGNRGNVYLGSKTALAAYEAAHAPWSEQQRAAKRKLDQWVLKQRRALEPKILADRTRHSLSLKVSEDELAAAMSSDKRAQWAELKLALQKINDAEPPAPPQAFVYRDLASEPAPTWLFPRGDFENPGQQVELGFLTVLTSAKSAREYWTAARSRSADRETTYQRSALADWLTDLEHGAGALLARVIVNRVWQHHFGQGLVRTPDDFGVQGEKPTHPELLEWMTADFVANGWRLKRLHRLIMTSAVYLQDITFDAASARVDPENRLLWRREPQRLEAEALRDAMLQAAGTLNLQPYGPGFKPPIPKEVMVARNLQSPYVPEPADSPNVHRRSVYMFHKRVIPHPLLELFDRPASSQSCGRRDVTLVAPQALALLNDPFVRDLAEHFSRRLLHGSQQTAGQIRLAFATSLARFPTDEELAAACDFVNERHAARQRRGPSTNADDAYQAALTDYCQVLFGLNEFLYID